MKPLAVLLILAAGASWAADRTPSQAPTPPPANPNIDMDGFLKVSKEAAAHRATRRVSEADFITMAKEPKTIVLDCRSKKFFDLSHVEGATNLPFPEIDVPTLAKVLPDKDARILIYCNNNFKSSVAFAPKAPSLSLNLSTYVQLYGYGYKNVYELAPMIDPEKTKLKLIAAGAK